MLTPLAVIRKLGLRHFYSITKNSLEIEMYKETECLRNYFITESIKADENEKSRQTMFSLLNFIPPFYIPLLLISFLRNSLFQTLPQDVIPTVFFVRTARLLNKLEQSVS